METISIFDIFKIGVGPSSSHTLGPWKAGHVFSKNIDFEKFDIDHLEVHLYGSLSKTGRGHATDVAVQLGLEGYDPVSVDTKKIKKYIADIKSANAISVSDNSISFNPSTDIIFHNTRAEHHPNTLTFKAFEKEKEVLSETYYSIGGGFIVKEDEEVQDTLEAKVPYPIEKAEDLEKYLIQTQKPIWEIVYENELTHRTAKDVEKRIDAIFHTMMDCVYRGCTTAGVLPGGLFVQRRAKDLCNNILDGASFDDIEEWQNKIRRSSNDFNTINKWVSCFALAVNEENADLGRVVTSPTNGAAGVIPAVLFYHYFFCPNEGMEDVRKFLYTSGEIGSLFKKGATISAAVGGCQAEIGVSSAMAAAGLTEVMGGTPKQVLMAAEIAMEHHLGLTCDPIGGLVQIPCIERNTMGAMKAITACNLALSSNPDHAKVAFDTVVKTMWDTAQEMNEKYKETSEGGLAFNLPVIFPDC